MVSTRMGDGGALMRVTVSPRPCWICWRERRFSVAGTFRVQSWTQRTALGEKGIGVDQTNESVVVGDAAVVKWATHLQEGPHPAPRRIGVLRDAGFDGMPTPWGLVTWRSPDSARTLVASVDELLPGAVDGWTWAVGSDHCGGRDDRRRTGRRSRHQVGSLVAELHVGLSGRPRSPRHKTPPAGVMPRSGSGIVCALPIP